AVRRAGRDDRARPVAACDVAVVREAAIDGPDRVRVHPEGRTELAHGREALTGLEAAGIDLVRQLPVDLGRDRDVRIALDIDGMDARLLEVVTVRRAAV